LGTIKVSQVAWSGDLGVDTTTILFLAKREACVFCVGLTGSGGSLRRQKTLSEIGPVQGADQPGGCPGRPPIRGAKTGSG
jgi:hypothetical protein